MERNHRLAEGLRHHQQGRLNEARTAYASILAANPEDADALHLFGVLEHQCGQDARAIELIQAAIRQKGGVAYYHSNLAECWRGLKEWDQAIASCQRALALDPRSAEAHINLGNALKAKGSIAAAIPHYQTARVLRPDNPTNLVNLAAAYDATGDLERALEPAREAVQLAPQAFDALAALGSVLMRRGESREALEIWERALRAKPHDARALNAYAICAHRLGDDERAVTAALAVWRANPKDFTATFTLANIHRLRRNDEEAEKWYEAAAAIDPTSPEVWNNWALLAKDQGRLLLAQARLRRALDVAPLHAKAWDNLGIVCRLMSDHAEAVRCFRKALATSSADAPAGSHLLQTLQMSDAYSPKQICETARQWGDAAIASVAQAKDFPPRAPGQRVRIGYLSGDFNRHPISYFLVGLLREHDRSRFEVFAYSSGRQADDWTARLRSHCEHWAGVAEMNDEALANFIRSHDLDLLVDVSGHTGQNRLKVFAHRAARKQATYLGFPGSTGLATIEYRITDPIADPPDESEGHYVERLALLPRCAWCYEPPVELKLSHDRRIVADDGIVFGCFNDYGKVTDALLQAWGKILEAVPGSRLLYKRSTFNDPAFATVARQRFAARGIDPSRLEFAPESPRLVDHFQAHDRIDVMLDTFPYHGTTTTCDALWMGVPVVTWCGNRHASRVGGSLLKAVGLSDLVGVNVDDYIAKAVRLARDASRRRELRTSLRETMQKSELRDAPGFARAFEGTVLQLLRRVG